MSELITRRTFLKAAGTAMAAAAAGGMLAGCGGAYASTPDGLVAAAVDSDKVVDFGAFTANIGRFDQWTSSSTTRAVSATITSTLLLLSAL